MGGPLVRVALTPAEADAVLRALDLVRLVHVARNRREQPRDLRAEEAAEEKLRAALGGRP